MCAEVGRYILSVGDFGGKGETGVKRLQDIKE